MSSSPNLIASLAQDRHAERYRNAQRGYGHRGRVISEARAFETTRIRAGWVLVGLGLRLIGSRPPRHGAAAQSVRLIGQ